jgi:hypothetical protein
MGHEGDEGLRASGLKQLFGYLNKKNNSKQ